jgi:hypothetical protein
MHASTSPPEASAQTRNKHVESTRKHDVMLRQTGNNATSSCALSPGTVRCSALQKGSKISFLRACHQPARRNVPESRTIALLRAQTVIRCVDTTKRCVLPSQLSWTRQRRRIGLLPWQQQERRNAEEMGAHLLRFCCDQYICCCGPGNNLAAGRADGPRRSALDIHDHLET